MEAKELNKATKKLVGELQELGLVNSFNLLEIKQVYKVCKKHLEYANTKALKPKVKANVFLRNEKLNFNFKVGDISLLEILRKYDKVQDQNLIKWIPIDKDNLPHGRVLAMSKHTGSKMIGVLRPISPLTIECRSGDDYIQSITH